MSAGAHEVSAAVAERTWCVELKQDGSGKVGGARVRDDSVKSEGRRGGT